MNKYRNLIVGILGQAVKDICKESTTSEDIKNKNDAEWFLNSEWCAKLADSVGIDQNKIQHKVAKIKEEQNDRIAS